MLACIVSRVEWFPTLHSFHLASDTAVARPRSQGPRCAETGAFPGWDRTVDHCSKGRNMKVAVASVLRMDEQRNLKIWMRRNYVRHQKGCLRGHCSSSAGIVSCGPAGRPFLAKPPFRGDARR
eukprot:1150484-Pelagomonas_calceolata.AAC.2